MSFGCSLKQAWGVDSLNKEKEKVIKDNRRGHPLPPVEIRMEKKPEEPPALTEVDTRLFYCIGIGAAAVLLLEGAFKLGVSNQ